MTKAPMFVLALTNTKRRLMLRLRCNVWRQLHNKEINKCPQCGRYGTVDTTHLLLRTHDETGCSWVKILTQMASRCYLMHEPQRAEAQIYSGSDCDVYFWISICLGQVPVHIIIPGQRVAAKAPMQPASPTVRHRLCMTLYDVNGDMTAQRLMERDGIRATNEVMKKASLGECTSKYTLQDIIIAPTVHLEPRTHCLRKTATL